MGFFASIEASGAKILGPTIVLLGFSALWGGFYRAGICFVLAGAIPFVMAWDQPQMKSLSLRGIISTTALLVFGSMGLVFLIG